MNELLFGEVIALVFLGGTFFGASLKKSAAAFGYSMLGAGSLFAFYVLHSGNVFAFTQTLETLVVRLFNAEPVFFIAVPIAFVVGLTFGFRVG